MIPTYPATLHHLLRAENFRIYLEGTHSTGKSTLMAGLVRDLGATPVEEPARAVLAQHGVTARFEGKTPGEIAEIQQQIMVSHLASELDETAGCTVHDRFAVSVYAYSLARLSRHDDHPYVADTLVWMRDRMICNQPPQNSLILLVPPTIALDVDTVREQSQAYRFHVHLLIRGLLDELRLPYRVLQSTTPENRLEEAKGYAYDAYMRYTTTRTLGYATLR